MAIGKNDFNLSEKIVAFREKHLKDDMPVKVTRQMTEDLLTMQRAAVEHRLDISELDTRSNEIFGEQAKPPELANPKPPALNSNQDRDLLNRAQRELECLLATHSKQGGA